jgi:hypothetical protein
MRIPALFFALAVMLVAVSNPHAAAVSNTFLLEVPELKVEVSENGSATIPNSSIRRLELHVLRSSQEVPPGKVIVRINGEAANTIMSTRATESVIVCDLDLYLRPGFLLQSGRNTIEASAESIYGRYYYGTFFLDIQDEPESLREIERETTVSREGEEPPLLHLINPQGPIQNARQLSLQGYVEGGVAPITVLVQGQKLQLIAGAPQGARGVQVKSQAYNFKTEVKLSATQESIEVTATDAHNNRSRWLIPVIRGRRPTGQRYAVVIGVSRYGDSRIPNLDFAYRDADAVRTFLLDPNGGGVPQANLLYLVNEKATFANIYSALHDFLIKPGPNDLVFIYFAGHGSADPHRGDNYYLLGYDTKFDRMSGTAFSMGELIITLDQNVQASVVSFVDACHSGAVGQTLPNISNQRWVQAGFGPHRAIITASKINEYSQEDSKWGGGHGVFTYFLLKGLQGEADVKHNHQISVGELFDFVKDHVKVATDGTQTPTALGREALGLVLTQGAPRAATGRQVPVPYASGEAAP